MPVSNDLLYDFTGLVTAPGKLARQPASATTADNLNFPAPGKTSKRTGWARQANQANGTVAKLWSFFGGMPVLYAKALNSGLRQLALGDGSGAEQTLTPPDSALVTAPWNNRDQAAQVARSIYVTAPGSEQPIRIGPEAWNAVGPWSGKTHYAGMPRGQAIVVNVSAGTLLPVGYGAAYRVTWHRFDGDGKLLSGPPSSRFVVRNVTGMPGGGGVNPVLVNFASIVPKQWGTGYAVGAATVAIDTSFFYRIWRTRTFDTATADSDEEYFLVYEKFATGSDITAGFVSFTDTTPNDFLTVPLNINSVNTAGIEVDVPDPGITNADEPPPLAQDVASWADVLWWGNIKYRPTAQVSFLSIGAPNGLQDGDTVTVTHKTGTVVLTARTTPTLPNEFRIFTLFATVAWNIEMTAASFAYVASQSLETAGAMTRVYALLPDSFAPVGTIMIEPMFGFTSSRSGWYRVSPNDALAQAGELTNGLAFSKPNRGDAVPLVSVLTAGPNDASIIRSVPYRDRLLVFTSRGVYQVTGSTWADFSVQPYALDLHLLAREAVCLCDDSIYAWCREGIVEFSANGYQIVSLPIEPTVQAAVAAATASLLGVAEMAYAVADTQNHRVFFWYPEGVITKPMCTAAFVYDTRTQAWGRHVFVNQSGNQLQFFSTGCVRATDFRLLSGGSKIETDSEGWIFLEKLTTDSLPYTDDGSSSVSPVPRAVTSVLALQFQVPDAAGAQHWQQSVMQLDDSRSLPTQLSLTWTTEAASATQGAQPVALRIFRLEPPPQIRRGNQMQLTVLSALPEYFGLVGLQQRYRFGSAFARQNAP